VLKVYAGLLDEVCDAYTGGACNLAPLAVEAVFEGFVEEYAVLETIALAVGAGTLGAGIIWIVGHYGTYRLAKGAFLALLEIVCADVPFLHG
jgi:hypothetical protein